MVKRFNIVTNHYSEISIPKDWKISTHELDENVIINCVHCGQPIKFGNSYPSMRYSTFNDEPYRECSVCYNNYLPLAKFRKSEQQF